MELPKLFMRFTRLDTILHFAYAMSNFKKIMFILGNCICHCTMKQAYIFNFFNIEKLAISSSNSQMTKKY